MTDHDERLERVLAGIYSPGPVDDWRGEPPEPSGYDEARDLDRMEDQHEKWMNR